jgi:DNA replication protein DnaC
VSDESEIAFEERAAAAKARQPVVLEPAPIAESMPAGFGEQREATCGCGAPFTQTKLANWTPTRCAECRGVVSADLRDETIDTQLRLRVAALACPPKYLDATIDTFRLHGSDAERKRQVRLTTAARRYLADWPDVPEVLVFRGGPGTGKGHLAWSIAKALIRLHPVDVRFTKLPDVIRDLREAWRSDGGQTEAARLERYRKPDLQIVDEVSRHAFYGEPHRHLYDLIDHRVDHCRPTIITTNETMDGLAEILLPALTSRVASSGLWEFGEADYRLFARKERDAA